MVDLITAPPEPDKKPYKPWDAKQFETLLKTADDHAEAMLEKYRNKAVADKLKNGEPLTAQDFIGSNEKYNESIKGIIAKQEKMTSSGFLDDPSDIRGVDVRDEAVWRAQKEKKDHPRAFTSEDVSDAFRKQHVDNAPAKDLSISPNVDTPQKLLSELIQKNNGVAISDVHTESAAFPLLSDNMKLLKDKKVDTIYTEMDPREYNSLNKLSIAELQKEIDSRSPAQIKAHAENFVKLMEKGARSDAEAVDSHGEALKLFLEAKKNGIDIVNIDAKARLVNYALGDHAERVAETNFIWSEAIAADRKDKPKDGKFVALAGLSHFTTDDQNGLVKGMVDDAFKLPVIAFDNRDPNTKNPVLKGDGPNAADFYLPKGECHPDTKILAKAADLDDKAKIDPDAKLKSLAEQYRQKFADTIRMDCISSDTNTKTPPAQSNLKPAQQGHSHP